MAVGLSWTRSGCVKFLLATLLLGWGLYMHYGTIIADGFQSVPGDLGDSRFNAIVLEHNFRVLTQQWPQTFWDLPWMFYPLRGGLALSDVMTGNLLTYAPFRFLGFEPLVAFIGFFFISSILNYVSSYLLLRAVGANWIGGVVGAFLISFSFLRGGFLNHAQLLPQYPTFISLLCFALYCKEADGMKKFVFLSLAAACFAWQFWAGFYLWWFCVFALMLAAPFLLLQSDFRRWGLREVRHPKAWGMALVIACALLLPLAVSYLDAQKIVGKRGFHELEPHLPILQAFIYPPRESLFFAAKHQELAKFNLSHETRMFLGWCFLIVLFGGAAAALRRRKLAGDNDWHRRIALLSAFLFGLILWLCLKRADGYSLWKYVYSYVPGASALRAVGRIAFLLLVLGVIPISYLLTNLTRMGKKGGVVALVLGLLLVVEQTAFFETRFPIAEHRSRIDQIAVQFAQNERREHCEVIYLKREGHPDFVQIDAMWFGLERHLNVVNGYSGNFPKEWWPRLMFTRDSSLESLREWFVAKERPDLFDKTCFIEMNS